MRHSAAKSFIFLSMKYNFIYLKRQEDINWTLYTQQKRHHGNNYRRRKESHKKSLA